MAEPRSTIEEDLKIGRDLRVESVEIALLAEGRTSLAGLGNCFLDSGSFSGCGAKVCYRRGLIGTLLSGLFEISDTLLESCQLLLVFLAQSLDLDAKELDGRRLLAVRRPERSCAESYGENDRRASEPQPRAEVV